MLLNGWIGVVLLGLSAIFGYPVWKGWRTRSVWLPISILSIQEIEHDKSPTNFWGVMIIDAIGSAAFLTAAVFVLGTALLVSPRPIATLRALDGCYEGEGVPDFMRPPVHWDLRLDNGSISNRAGETVSRQTYLRGAETGEASMLGGRATIRLMNEWGDVLLRTTCG